MKQTHITDSPASGIGHPMQHTVAPDMPLPETEACLSMLQPLEIPSHEFLSQLAREDSQAYEALRRELLESFIESTPARHKRRLRGLQFRVDNERRLSHTALGSTVRIYQLMWESFLCLNREWQDFARMNEECEKLQEPTQALEYVPKRTARIIEFRPSHALDSI